MEAAWDAVYQCFRPMATCGSLPCIKELQDEGFDVQMMGFGAMSVYHANNEYCSLAAFKQGLQLLVQLVRVLQ
jgi:acetylornithine deacetylase